MRSSGVISSMTRFATLLCALTLLLSPAVVQAQCDGECVAKDDLTVLLDSLEEKKCLTTERPTLILDPVTVVTDEQGRVYYSGAEPKPYNAHLHWCNYDVTFEGKVKTVVAERTPEVWGFRFKLKFAGSVLAMDAVERNISSAVDVGLLWDLFHWRDLNLNVVTGFRSVGAGVGYDVTSNFGVFGGYGFSFWTLRSNPQAGLYFGFW
jgi:hypothetical protein